MARQIPVTWRIAFRVLVRHNQRANTLTLTLSLACGLFGWLIAWLIGLNTTAYWHWLQCYKWYLLGVLLIIHFSVVNVYAVRYVLTHPLGDFRLVVMQNESAEQTGNSEWTQ